jgi:hypothetical protein
MRNRFGQWPGFRSVLLAAIALCPAIVATILPMLGDWQPAVAAAAIRAPEREVIPDLLSSLSTDLGSLAVAILVGTVVLARERLKKGLSRAFSTAALTSVLLCTASVIAGLRFRFALIQQLCCIDQPYTQVVDRLGMQSATLLAAFGLLAAMAASIYLLPPTKRVTT